MRRTARHRFAGALTALTLALVSTSVGAWPLLFPSKESEPEEQQGRELRDLNYGNVLFDFYKQDYFTAMARLIAARQMGQTQPHAQDGELLLGGMLLSYGQHAEAADIFQRQMVAETRPEARNRAWFYLARMSYERGALDQARAALARIEPGEDLLPPEMEAESRVLAAQILIRKGQYDAAAAALRDWDGPEDWSSYAKFNLGVALVRAQRVEEGSTYLEQVGTEASGTEEQLAIRDRANVALGYASMQANKPEEARTAFQRVRLDGPSSNKALLGLGWAESALDHDRKALVPWTELSKRDVLDSAVQESLLAIPYAMARLDRPVQSAQNYEKAISTYEQEIQRLDQAIERIRSGQMISALLAEQGATELGVSRRLESLPQSDETRFLYAVMAGDQFQETLRNYRDLLFLKANLAEWKADVSAFDDMLATDRAAASAGSEQTVPMADIAALRQRRTQLAQRLSAAEAASGVVDAPEAVTVRRTLNEAGIAIGNLEERQLQLGAGSAAASPRLQGFADRVATQRANIDRLSGSVDTALQHQADYLQALAIQQLVQQQERLRSYMGEARFALARVYDRAGNPPDATPQTEVQP